MKLRLDLLEHLTAEDILDEAKASQHRYKAEPSLGTTGVGYLIPATVDERAEEITRSTELIRRLEERARAARELEPR